VVVELAEHLVDLGVDPDDLLLDMAAGVFVVDRRRDLAGDDVVRSLAARRDYEHLGGEVSQITH
tara:strand:- start:113 stop:304 length:192 start_codon:yes stop_codon:yes gene_type:complete